MPLCNLCVCMHRACTLLLTKPMCSYRTCCWGGGGVTPPRSQLFVLGGLSTPPLVRSILEFRRAPPPASEVPLTRFRPQARAPPLGVCLPHQRCGDGEEAV